MWDSDEEGTPFWLETTDYSERCRRIFFNTDVLLILLLAIAFAFFFIVTTSNISKPQDVKKSWDSFILVIVLFAVICAFLNKTNGDDESPRSNGHYEFSTPEHHDRVRRSNPLRSVQWFYDRTSSADNGRERCRRFFFNAGVFLILILVIAFAFIFIVIPSFLCFTSNIFKHHLVKKTWDSLNLVIVLFAVICGFLNKCNGNDETPRSNGGYEFSSTPEHGVVVDDYDRVRRSNPSSSGQWSADRTAYGPLRRMRSSRSNPNLRQESTWVMNGDDRWRFYDDSGLYNFRSRSRREHDEEQVYFSNSMVRTTHPSPSPPPYQAPVPPPAATIIEPSAPPIPELSPSQSPKERSDREEIVYYELRSKHSRSPPPSPVAPPPPPSFPPYQASVSPPVATPIKPSAPPAAVLPPSQPLKVARMRPKRTYEPPRDRSEREKTVYNELKNKHSLSSPPPPAAPLPSPPPYRTPVPPPVATTIKPSAPPAPVLPPSQPLKVARMNRSEHEKTMYNELTNKHSLSSPPPPAAPPPPPSPRQYQVPVSPSVPTTLEPSAPPAPDLPPLQRPQVTRMKPKRAYEDEEVVYSESKNKHSLSSPSSSATPPPPEPIVETERRSNRSQKKKGGVTEEFLKFLRRKKKKQRQRSVENLDEFFNLATLPLCPSPPPPPRPSFYNISTSKKNKGKKQHSVPPPPPPPPPPSKREPNKRPVTIKKPPLAINIRNVKNVEECTDSGNESSSSSIPQPPPPPPFNIPVWQYEVLGDFVRLKSINGSRNESSDLEDPFKNAEECIDSGNESSSSSIPQPPPPPPFNIPVWQYEVVGDFVRLKSINGSRSRSYSDYPFGHEASSSDGNKTGNVDNGESPASSSDVNTKADNLIARVKAGWKLEKNNSVKRRSNLGLDPGPSNV